MFFRKKRIKKYADSSELWKKIGAIKGQIQKDELYVLYKYAERLPEKSTIVEIGSYRGKSTVAMGLGAILGDSKVYAIDPHIDFKGVNGGVFGPLDLEAKLFVLNKFGLGNCVFPICLRSHDVGKVWAEEIDLLWIDGDHTYEGVKGDFLYFSKFLKKGGYVLFHDSDISSVDRCIGEIDSKEYLFQEGVGSLKSFKKI